MKKTITTSNELNSERKPYDNFINDMRAHQNNLTFFRKLLKDTLKAPTDENLKQLEAYAALLPVEENKSVCFR